MKHIKTLPFLLSLLFILSSCGPDEGTEATEKIVAGQLRFVEDQGCASPVDSQNVSWAQCHDFKNHINPATNDFLGSTQDVPIYRTYRPLSSKVFIFLYAEDPTRTSGRRLCDVAFQQTNPAGLFGANMTFCNNTARHYVVLNALLSYDIQDPAAGAAGVALVGTIKALWQEALARDLFGEMRSGPIQDLLNFTRVDRDSEGVATRTRFAIPRLQVSTRPVAPNSSSLVYDLGRLTLINTTDEINTDNFGYMRQVLSSYESMVQIHRNSKNEFNRTTDYPRGSYFNTFVDNAPTPGAGKQYTVWYDANWAFGFGGGISLYRPDEAVFNQDMNADGIPDGAGPISWLLSSTSVLGHEFGHSLQARFAPSSFNSDYNFVSPFRRNARNPMPTPEDPEGLNYNWGHGGWQYQELGVAFTEGFANGIGQFFINKCNGFVPSSRPVGGANPFVDNIWNPADSSCDDTDACRLHTFRWQMWFRGINDSDRAFTERRNRLVDLTNFGVGIGHYKIISNNETRVGEAVCDLLDNDTNVSHAVELTDPAGTTNARFISNFTYWVARILNGYDGSLPTASRFASRLSPNSENVQMGLAQALQTANRFCRDCVEGSLPDGGTYNDSNYVEKRVNIYNSGLSIQSFLLDMISNGLINRNQANIVLQSNFMEPLL
jgi:hypothetical protein